MNDDAASTITAALERDEGIDLLVDMMAVATRFRFFILACGTPRVVRAAIAYVQERMTVERGAPVRIHMLDPYSSSGASLDGPLEPEILHDQVLPQLLAPPARSSDEVVVLDASRALHEDDRAWNLLFQRMNEQRNQITRSVPGPLILCVPPRLEVVFARAAPDFWSIRSLAVSLKIAPLYPARTSFLQELTRTTAFSGFEMFLFFTGLTAAAEREEDMSRKCAVLYLKTMEELISGDLTAALQGANSCRQLVASLPNPDSWLISESHRILAWSLCLLGETHLAALETSTSVSLARERLSRSQDAKDIRTLVVCLIDQSQIDSFDRVRPTSIAPSEEAVQLAHGLLAGRPEENDSKFILAACLECLGDIAFQDGRPELAERHYSEAIEYRRELHSLFPKDRTFRRWLAESLIRKGLAVWARAGADAALAECLEGINALRQLSQSGWWSEHHRHALALHLGNLGDLQRERGDPERAGAAYGESIQICRELHKKDPGNVFWCDTEAMSWIRWARYCDQEKRAPSTALDAWRAAGEIFKEILRVAPARSDWARMLAECDAELVRLSDSLGIGSE